MHVIRISIFGILCTFTFLVNAQITNRIRPIEWADLVKGARFMDRFLPMDGHVLSSETWGTDSVRPRYIDNGIELENISFWGGNIIQTFDKKYHLFICGWAEDSPKGHWEWPNSIVYHASADCMNGPFIIQDTIGKGHNPEAFQLIDGRIVIYVIDGYYIANNVNGPWKYSKFKFDPRGRKIIEGLSNLTFSRRADGSYLMVCRGGGIWISRTGLSTYNQLTDKRVYPDVEGKFEDPVIWKDSLQYHLIVNDWLGRIAFYQRSKDGVHWITEPGEAYVPGISRHKDGYIEYWFKYERPKIFQDKYGRAVQMNFAVIDTIKWEDHPNDTHSSKNICIPLNKGLLLSVLNQEPITDSTSTIDVRISAEEDFNPHAEIDIASLRFGSHTKVNIGQGCRPIRTKRDGKDLIVTFNGKNSGITSDEFAPKLIGQNNSGNLLFGYAYLPYVDYNPPLLSIRYPIDIKDDKLELIIENFGLAASKTVIIKVTHDNMLVAKGVLKSLKPYESIAVSLPIESLPIDNNPIYKVDFQ